MDEDIEEPKVEPKVEPKPKPKKVKKDIPRMAKGDYYNKLIQGGK